MKEDTSINLNSQVRPLILVFLLFLLSCNRYHLHDLYRDTAAISHFEMLMIDGVKHAVLIRGEDRGNPLMIYLHGGPGFPLFPFEPRSQAMEKMEELFTVVYWEQRGTGKSFSWSIPRESMNLSQFVEDTRRITEYAMEMSGQEKVFVWGHSWGSNVGVLFADHYPQLIYAYIGTGQSVNPYLNERLCYKYVERQALKENNRRALRQLEWIDTIPEHYTLEDALTVRRWVYQYGGILQQQDRKRPYVNFREIRCILSAAEYSLTDRISLILYPYFSAEQLWGEMKELNLMKRVPGLSVPVYFLLGRNDIIVSASLASVYFEMLNEPEEKHLIWFEESAHRPHTEETDKFIRKMGKIRSNHWPEDTTGRGN